MQKYHPRSRRRKRRRKAAAGWSMSYEWRATSDELRVEFLLVFRIFQFLWRFFDLKAGVVFNKLIVWVVVGVGVVVTMGDLIEGWVWCFYFFKEWNHGNWFTRFILIRKT